MLAPVRTVDPTATPVSLIDAKAHLRVDFDDDDPIITALIDTATDYVDGWSGVLGRCLVNQTWRVDFCDWPACRILRLPFPDVSAATVTYFDADNAEKTVQTGMASVLSDARGSFIRFSNGFTYPSLYDDRLDAVQVEFTAGYGDAAAVPASIKAAILLIIGHLYHNREASLVGVSAEDLPMGVSALLAQWRRVGV